MSSPAEWSRIGEPYWSDRPVFIVGGGTSLKGFDFNSLRGRGYVLAVKQAWRDLPFADACFGLDRAWQTWARDDLLALTFTMPLWIAIEPEWTGFKPIAGAHYLRMIRKAETLSESPWTVESGGNSGFGAFNFAYLKRARRIVLLGFDFGPSHYDPSAYTPRPDDHNLRYMQGWADNFSKTLPQLRAAGVTVLNASPASKISAFPKMTPAEALARIEQSGAA